VILKIVRVIKMNLIAVLPFVVGHNHLIFAIAMAIFQILATGIFCFKFTYRQAEAEYCLLVSAFAGLISAGEHLLTDTIDHSYVFLGELLMAVLWFLPFPLTPLLEVKYSNALQHPSEAKTEEEHLVDYLYIRECLFPAYRSLPFSKGAQS
jgi:hypothetical protein